jgi:electron transfer flavoprotein beta subunit
VDLVLTGKQSVDDNSGAVFAGVAATLGWPLVTGVSKIVDISGGRATVERFVEGGQETLSVPLPAVLSVGKEINDPRYPSFMGIRKASKANIPATPAGVAPNSGKTQWTNIRKPEERKSKVTMIDGASAQEKAAKLADALIADKVI